MQLTTEELLVPVAVICVYEVQLEECVQGKELGKFLTQLVECIAYRNGMSAVTLTFQKVRVLAKDFYMSKSRCVISFNSPLQTGFDKSYEILGKVADREAK
ncbi:N-alpha-acetyltransferase 40-like [Papaver somniferum]|uniref:N-alpha-acetyltransferase 40-like n=1 Tax=Papaver somniferum TaxID=3469 RepID=UPI000E6FB9E2|nr:N-alpha-acetyltransferase 40-like [Papaver somniferum]